MSWVRPLDPTGGALGMRGRYAPKPDAAPRPAPVAELPEAPALPVQEPEAATPAPEPPRRSGPSRIAVEMRTRLPPETARGRVLIAAATCAGGSPVIEFRKGDLVVRAWSLFPETFGLPGFVAQHPDSNRVLSKVYGGDGLADAGYLARLTTDGALRLTTQGAEWWRLVGAKWLAERQSAGAEDAR